jgi:hypothetical protein
VEYRRHDESQARLSDAPALPQQIQGIPSVHAMPGLCNGVLSASLTVQQPNNSVDLADHKLPFMQER